MELPICIYCHARRVKRKSQWLCSRTCANGYRGRSVEERFTEFCHPGPPNKCWIWRGTIHYRGYGVIGDRHNHQFLAHRLAYERAYGPIPPGMLVCHSCDNPPCVNPAHLWLGTDGENQRDKAIKGRGTQGERSTHAKLTTADVIAIRAMTGISQTAIAQKFGIDQTSVSAIILRKSWAHIP